MLEIAQVFIPSLSFSKKRNNAGEGNAEQSW